MNDDSMGRHAGRCPPLAPRVATGALLLLLAGCPRVHDITPAEFPTRTVEILPTIEPYDGTPLEPLLAEPTSEHRFVAVVQQANVVEITVDGTPHAMTRVDGQNVYRFDAVDKCTASHTYTIQARNQFGAKTVGPKTVPVNGFGTVFWFVPGAEIQGTGDILSFTPDYTTRRIVLRNLTSKALRVQTSGIVGSEASHFSAALPTNTTLQCGESIVVDVSWTMPDASQLPSDATLTFAGTLDNQGWTMSIALYGLIPQEG